MGEVTLSFRYTSTLYTNQKLTECDLCRMGMGLDVEAWERGESVVMNILKYVELELAVVPDVLKRARIGCAGLHEGGWERSSFRSGCDVDFYCGEGV